MARPLAFLLFVLAAFSVGVPFLDRAGVALLGLGFLAYVTPRAPSATLQRLRSAALTSADLPKVDAGKTPPSLRRYEPFPGAAGVAEDDEDF